MKLRIEIERKQIIALFAGSSVMCQHYQICCQKKAMEVPQIRYLWYLVLSILL